MDDDVHALLKKHDHKHAFERLLDLYEVKVFRMAIMYMKDQGRAEEVTQDIFLKLWQVLPTYDGRAAVSTWLYTIARNTCLSALRSESHRKTQPLDSVAEPASPEPTGSSHVLQRMQLTQCLERLPESQREVITLFYLQEKKSERSCANVGSTRRHRQKPPAPRPHRPRCNVEGVEKMNCLESQQQILEALTEGHPFETQLDLKSHLGGCEDCQAFLEAQTRLDRQLAATLAAPALSPAFRTSLAKKIRHEPLTVWPEFLPDTAHIAGCIGATVVCLAVLPFPAATIALAGTAFTLVTYFFQTAIRSSLESLEEER
jgi:RNA polymerase sigma-70 factor, ECF subfamily